MGLNPNYRYKLVGKLIQSLSRIHILYVKSNAFFAFKSGTEIMLFFSVINFLKSHPQNFISN